jgi:hypothetical protein
MPHNPGPPGLGHVGSYQASGKPFVSGAIDVNAATVAGTPLEITFPSITRWIAIKNIDNTVGKNVTVGASLNGLEGDNNFVVEYDKGSYRNNSSTPRFELRLSKIYLTGSSTNVDVIAGLTGISSDELPNNWSGSAGVG